MLSGRARRRLLPRALTGLIFAAAELLGCRELVLPVLPLLLLVLSLLSGQYPGCEVIVRLAERIGSRSRRAGALKQLPPGRPESSPVGGGLLIALGLATRPPPLPA